MVHACTFMLRAWGVYCNPFRHGPRDEGGCCHVCLALLIGRFFMLAEMTLAANAEAQGTAQTPIAGASAAWEAAASVGTQAGVPGTPSSSSVRSYGELPAQHCLAMFDIADLPLGSGYGASLVKNLAADALKTTAQLPCKHAYSMARRSLPQLAKLTGKLLWSPQT